ncbi:MAG: hypothetical protein IJW05_10995 [Lentisphaeria bacterium]|nr:hypothetical protein [Lentisphaeria bacterium]
MNQEHRLENTFFFLIENTLAASIVPPGSVKKHRKRGLIKGYQKKSERRPVGWQSQKKDKKNGASCRI